MPKRPLSKVSILVLALLTIPLLSCGRKKSGYVGPKEPFPYLGRSASFAVLADKNVINTGTTTIYGDVGVSSPDGTVSGLASVKMTGGAIHQRNSLASNAQHDAAYAYQNLKDKDCDQDLTGQNLGGRTLTPGTYCFSGDARLDGLLTLDFQGNKNANFVFQIGSSLVLGADSGMHLIHNGESCNVFWQVPGSVTFENNANVVGGFLVVGDILLDNNDRLNGKLSSRTGSVTIHSSEIYNNFCPWPG